MNNFTSSIRKIGLINSGMFDTLTLNFDVQAIHLVGANNVGKTSLIALIQFLFFPTIHEMTFIKSVGESMNFYFRPEGSYILFEVRTITGNIRTVGIYGTGESDSRVNFVFNGSFDLEDFLNGENIPVPLQDVQAQFFSRDFARYDKFERYEDALLGQHTSGKYNVPMFDLSKTNYRLLRKLMQGLLRLDRIDAADVQRLLIQIVEKGAIKTSFNLAQDFEQKYRHINQLRIELQALETLKPFMMRYQKIITQIGEKEEHRQRHAERLYHLSSIYLEHLATKKENLAERFKAQEEQLEKLSQSIKILITRVNTTESTMAELNKQKERWHTLMESSRDHSEPLVKKERDDLTHARVELQKALSAARPHNASSLKRQLNALTREHKGVMRQLAANTLEQIWVQAGFDEAHRALLNFLIANDLTSLDASNVLSDPKAFVEASAQVVDYLDADGNFQQFGLDVPRSVWFVAEKDQEPLEARRIRLENDMAKIRIDIDIDENVGKKKQELAALNTAIQAKETLLNNFTELARLIDQWQRPETLETKCKALADDLTRLNQALAGKEEESKSLRQQQHLTHTALQLSQDQWRHVRQDHEKLQPFETDPPESLRGLSPEALSSEYDQVRGELSDIIKSLTRLTTDLKEPKDELEGRYDKSGADIPFEQWLALKSNLADEIQGLEVQLQREYDAIFTLVRAKLSKITQAYQSVESQVAALNKTVRNVRISNIEQIGITLENTDLLDAIDQSIPGQLDLFATRAKTTPLIEAHARVEDYFNQIKKYGNEINLKDMFRLKFSVQFNYQPKPVERYEIHRFESNGTETGVKIVIYLGLIGLLQERKNIVGTRIPFFLDEVGSIDSDNLNQLISYCTSNNFLPIFASPEIRKDISHNYLFKRNGSRSYLAAMVKITKKQQHAVHDESSNLVDQPA
jgi:hypothetical protein